ncbi:lysophospholipid acyltransferase family protein [Chitinibacteraceae bacterium HSL-7]
MMANRAWRIVATAFCLLAFCAGGLLLMLALIVMSPLPRAKRTHVGRYLVHLAFRVLVALLCGLGVLKLTIRGQDKLARPGLLVLANHPSLLDVTILMSLIRQPDCVVKSSLWRNPFTAGPVRVAGFTRNDNGPALIDDCIASVRHGNALIIFPEGTRSTPGAAPLLQRGAANIAWRGQLAITPVHITVSTPYLTKGKTWMHVPDQQPHFFVTVLDDVDCGTICPPSTEPALAARKITTWLEQNLCKESACPN